MMMRLIRRCSSSITLRQWRRYPSYLLQTLRESSLVDDPCVVVMTPGASGSAYFEHSFLGAADGVELVESADLFIKNGAVYMRTTEGRGEWMRIYRRIDDAQLDPLAFAPIPCSAYRGCCQSIAPAAWCWPTLSAPASPTTNQSTRTFRR